MRADLIDAGNEIVLNLLESKLRQFTEFANAQVTKANALPSGSMTRLANTRLLIQSMIDGLIDIEGIAAAVMKEVSHHD